MTVLGKPIEFPKIEKPTKEDIDKYHRLYVDALMALYKANKRTSGRRRGLRVGCRSFVELSFR